MPALGPRLVVAGTHSGAGKTTVATGLMGALRARGVAVAAAKVGPDYVDPGYHTLATGRPGRNLDAWLCGPAAIAPLAARAGAGASLLVVEGVMGLFDGAADGGPAASTAHVASLLDAPVVLVVDASSMSGSVAALVHGFATFHPAPATPPPSAGGGGGEGNDGGAVAPARVAAVVLNRVGSDGHEVLLREALAPLGIPVLGALRRDAAFAWRDRHLGLVPVVEQRDEARRSLARLAAAVERDCDVAGLTALAGSAAPRVVVPPPASRPVGRCRLAVASGPAFGFTYPETLELLAGAGAEVVPFDPTVDAALPESVDGLYAGGGFPEVFAAALAENTPLLAEVRRRVTGGLVTWAECGGLLWLSRSLDGHPLCGAVPAVARMTDRLTLGYRRAKAKVATPVVDAGREVRGHEFHYSTIDPAGDALETHGRFGGGPGGYASSTLLASYLHVHPAGDPQLVERFVATAAAASAAPPTGPRAS